MKQSKVAWIECMCSEICCFGSARCSKVVRSPYNARHTQSCFVIFLFMAWEHSIKSWSLGFAV